MKKKDNNKNKTKGQKILAVLIGPPGSAKTTYACNTLNNFMHINQDLQGRSGHYLKFLKALLDGEPKIVIDRLNFNIFQRSKYVIPARYLNYKISYYLFNVDPSVCSKRMRERTNHPTIKQKDYKTQKKVLEFYYKEFEEPKPFEYNEIITVL